MNLTKDEIDARSAICGTGRIRPLKYSSGLLIKEDIDERIKPLKMDALEEYSVNGSMDASGNKSPAILFTNLILKLFTNLILILLLTSDRTSLFY